MQDKENKAPEIPKAIQQHLSNAKRHHYVPEFLLRRFSTNPAEEHPQIYRLDVKTGAISKLSTLNCAVIQHYNRLSAASGLPAGFAEAMLSYAESRAIPLVEKLLHGEILDLQERVEFSIFLMAQQMRTPRGREWLRFGQDQAAKFWVLKQLYENRDITKEHLREDLGREPTEDEIDESIRQTAEPLERDELRVSTGQDMEILGMFTPAPDLIPLIGEMNWILLEASGGQSFILSDDPLVRLDVFVNDIGGQFRIRIGARDSFERVTAKQIWGPCDNEKGNHLAFDNEKGSHLWHISTSPCPNGVAQTVPESFLPPTVQRLSSCPVACPTSAAARYRVPDPRCGLLFQSHAKSRPRRRWGDRVRARSSWP